MAKIVKQVFEDYKKYITQCVIEEFGTSYLVASEVQDNWRLEIKYSPECEEMLLLKTNVFIRMLEHKDPNYRNLDFLKSLTNKISSYLALYITSKAPNADYNTCLYQLRDKLYTNSSYVQSLENNLKSKRQNRHIAISNKSQNAQDKKVKFEHGAKKLSYQEKTREIITHRISKINPRMK